MAFWGCSFLFDGVPSDHYELMVYDIDGHTQEDGRFANSLSVLEDTIHRKWRPFFYGTEMEDKLSFRMVFGVNEDRVNSHNFLDRYELEAVAAWLTGHNEYKWLEISQDDMVSVRYRCVVTDLEIIEYDRIPWALSMEVECDSPYAYKYPQVFEYKISGQKDIVFFNESTHNGYYMPKIEIDITSGNSFEIINNTDKGRVSAFTSLPTAIKKLTLDNEHGVISSGDAGLNPYPYFNYKFFRLKRGENHLTVTGNGTLRILCEFPVNVGG